MGVSVFGHRGACGYLPENTMPSFELAFDLGVDAIEFDVVLTKDHVPVILHDLDLTHTTTVSEFPELPTDVNLVELSQLRALRVNERYPEGRSESAKQSGRFPIPTLAEVLANRRFDNRHLIIELKHGKHQLEIGLDVVGALKSELEKCNWQERGMQITVECFEFGILREAKSQIGSGITYVFLSAPDMLPAGRTNLDDDLLDEIAQNFEGLSVAIPMLWEHQLVERAKSRSLVLFAYTARIETAPEPVETWFRKLASSGVDGLFADQPDVLIKTVASLS